MSTREITVKMSDLIDANGALDKLLGAKLPAALSFRLSMLAGEVGVPFKHFNDQRASLLKEHGKTSDGGQTFNLEGEGRRAFEETMGALGNEEVTVKVPQLSVSDLGEREILSPAEFYALRWLFSEEESGQANAVGA